MTRPAASLLFATLAVLSPLPARADASLNAYDAARAALLAVWAELPLTIRNVAITDGAPAGYGNYAVHDGNSFSPGDTIHIYAEVLGYGWKDNGDGTWSQLLDADLALLDADGTTIASKPKFLTTDTRSRQQLLESDLAFNVTLSGFGPGAYKLQFAVHDRTSSKETQFEVPVTLLAAGESSASDATASSAPASDASSSAP